MRQVPVPCAPRLFFPDAEFVDVADDRSKKPRLPCTCRHLKHHTVHLIPCGKNVFLSLLLIRV